MCSCASRVRFATSARYPFALTELLCFFLALTHCVPRPSGCAAAVDEEGNETGEPSYVAVLDYPEEKDEEGNVIEPEPFNVVAPAP